jgi:hypothetical protein
MMNETYNGWVRTPGDAIKLFEACRLGLLPRVQRRLSEKERQSIRPGSVFVWDEREAGMRRWTDGKSWSASRVSGSFLTYREMEGKRTGGVSTSKRHNNKTPDSGRGSDEDQDDGEPEGYRYKADGLMKQSFSITTANGQHLHLISYYSRPGPGQPDLPQPSKDPALRGIVPVKGLYPESSMGETNPTPAMTRAPMQAPPYMAPHPSQQHPLHQGPPPPAPYPQQGYGWPPSPVSTPPYSHSHYSPYAVETSRPGATAQPHYTHVAAAERAPRLPPLPVPHSQRGSPPQGHDMPREHQLQAAAHAVSTQFDPIPRNGQMLPSLANGGAPHGAMTTPPSRALSASPGGRSLFGDMPHHGAKPSLSSLLKTEPGSSPKMQGLPPLGEKGALNEDTRALRMLDRKFCI